MSSQTMSSQTAGNTTMDNEGKQNEILDILVAILDDMIADWDTDMDEPMGSQTRLIADLGFESIDVVQFITAIEEHYRCRTIPFEQLVMQDGRYVDEITVGNTVTFLQKHLKR